MIYFDSCFILKCYLNEHGSTEVRKIWDAASGCVSCELARAEVIAGIHRHLREGRISKDVFLETIEDWTADEEANLWDLVPLKLELFEEVERLFVALPSNVYLRASDALHIACVKMLGLHEIYSNDRHLLKAATHFGIAPRNVIPPP